MRRNDAGMRRRDARLVVAIACLPLLLNHPGSDAARGSDPRGPLAFCGSMLCRGRPAAAPCAPAAPPRPRALCAPPRREESALQLRASGFWRAPLASLASRGGVPLAATARSAAGGNSSVADANADGRAEGVRKRGAGAGKGALPGAGRKKPALNTSAAVPRAAAGSSSKRGGASRAKPSAARQTSTRGPKGSARAQSCTGTGCGSGAASDSAFSTRSRWGGELGPIQALIMGKIIIDEFVLRRQPEAKVVRTGLGGGSPQAAVGARLWGGRVGLVAPVGQGFAQEMLSPLEIAGIDTQGVARLKGYVTPHTQIRYEAERMIWTPGEGWDRWTELGREILPIPERYQGAKLLHVITEGAGGAEVDMAGEVISQALRDADASASLSATDEEDRSRDSTREDDAGHEVAGWACVDDSSKARTVLSVEPVIHTVTEGTIENLRRITSNATVVSPDWETAVKISKMCTAAGEPAPGDSAVEAGTVDVSGCILHPHLMGKYEVRKGGQYWGGRPVYAMTRGIR
jgi:hypothetical protein